MGAFTKFKKTSGKEISESYQFIQIIFTLIALIHAWTLQYKSPDSTPSLLNRISFIVEDAPWMPPGLKSEAILHLHHFGDWTLGIGYALTSNPYSQDLEIPAPVPPFGLVVMKLFALVGFQISYLNYLTRKLQKKNLLSFFSSSCSQLHQFLPLTGAPLIYS